jgi:hypothetical protein
MATTIGDTISRVRNTIRGVREDAFLTDRFIYSLVLKYAKLYIRRQDTENKIMRFQSLFETLPCVDLIEVDKVEACCSGIKSKCIIMRTKDRLPTVLEGAYGPLFRTISSIDGSQQCYKTYPSTYTNMANTVNFKYNQNKYYWYSDGYLYFPNLIWDSVRVEGLWDASINFYKCDGDVCQGRQQDPTHVPEYLFAEIEKAVLGDIMILAKMPVESGDDKQNILRS